MDTREHSQWEGVVFYFHTLRKDNEHFCFFCFYSDINRQGQRYEQLQMGLTSVKISQLPLSPIKLSFYFDLLKAF